MAETVAPVKAVYTPLASYQLIKANRFLKDIELDNNIDVLHAVDIGPISYGLNFPEAPICIQFIYRQKDTLEHFTLFDRINNFSASSKGIEAKGLYVTKALSMAARTDASVMEYIQSLHVYKRNNLFINSFVAATLSHCPRTLAEHHMSILERLVKYQFKRSAAATTSLYVKALYHSMVIKWIIKSPQFSPPLNLSALVNRAELLDGTHNLAMASLFKYKEEGDVEFSSPSLFNFYQAFDKWAPKCIEKLPTKQPNLDALRDLHKKTVLG